MESAGAAFQPRAASIRAYERERLLWLLAAATFLIFFQAYMVAPLIPRLAAVFQVSPQTMGLTVPAYMIPYGASILFYGLLSDRIGRRRIILASFVAFVVLSAATASARSASQLIFWRLLTGSGRVESSRSRSPSWARSSPSKSAGGPSVGCLGRWPAAWLRVSALRDQPDRSIVITKIGGS